MNNIIYKLKCCYNLVFNRNTIWVDGNKIKLTQVPHLSQDQLRDCIQQYETALIICPKSISGGHIELSDGVWTYNDMTLIRRYSFYQIERNVNEMVKL